MAHDNPETTTDPAAPLLHPARPFGRPRRSRARRGPVTFLMPNLRVSVVRDQPVRTQQHPVIDSSRALAAALDSCIPAHAAREHVVMALLDARRRLLGVHTVSVGGLAGALVHPRDVFRIAVLAGASGVGFGHNHPSGDPEPSDLDIDLTRRLCLCAKLLGITVVDHVIFGEGRCWVSLRSVGHVPDLDVFDSPPPVSLTCTDLARKLHKRRSGAAAPRAHSRRARREPAVEPLRPAGGRP